jgi:hypothetical protein
MCHCRQLELYNLFLHPCFELHPKAGTHSDVDRTFDGGGGGGGGGKVGFTIRIIKEEL